MDFVKLRNKSSIWSDKRRAVEMAGTTLESARAESFIQVNSTEAWGHSVCCEVVRISWRFQSMWSLEIEKWNRKFWINGEQGQKNLRSFADCKEHRRQRGDSKISLKWNTKAWILSCFWWINVVTDTSIGLRTFSFSSCFLMFFLAIRVSWRYYVAVWVTFSGNQGELKILCCRLVYIFWQSGWAEDPMLPFGLHFLAIMVSWRSYVAVWVTFSGNQGELKILCCRLGYIFWQSWWAEVPMLPFGLHFLAIMVSWRSYVAVWVTFSGNQCELKILCCRLGYIFPFLLGILHLATVGAGQPRG
jgi:hypothetical protein